MAANIFKKSFSSGDYREKLEQHRVTLVQSLDLARQYMFSHLRSNKILDEEDCEKITSADTRQQKNAKFLDVISRRGEKAFDAFVDALEYELPAEYKLLTGKEARVVEKSDDAWGGFDREFSFGELVKVSKQYSTLSYRHAKVQKEKQLLEKELLKVTSLMKTSVKCQEELKFELSIKDRIQNGVEEHDHNEMNVLLRHCQCLKEENAEKSNVIIALQARLLAVKEENDKMDGDLEDLQMINKSLKQTVKDLSVNYDFQRKRSLKLQERCDMTDSELVKSAELDRESHVLKFNLSNVTEEKEALSRRLDDYRNVVTALNAKLCLLQDQKAVESEKRSKISEENLKIRQQAKIYEMERDQRHCSSKPLLEKVSRLEEDVLIFREEKAFLSEQLTKTARERDRAIQEREEYKNYSNELLQSRDEAVRTQTEISKKLEAKYNNVTSELDAAKAELQNIMLEHVRRNSSSESRAKCEVFETEWDNTKRDLRKSSFAGRKKVLDPPLTDIQIEEKEEDVIIGEEEEEKEEESRGEQEAEEEESGGEQEEENGEEQEEEEEEPSLVLRKTNREQQDGADDRKQKSRISVIDQAIAVLDGEDVSVDNFSLNNQQLNWVYDSLKGKKCTFQAMLNNPLVFPQFKTATLATATNNADDNKRQTRTQTRRFGSNRRRLKEKTYKSFTEVWCQSSESTPPPATRARSSRSSRSASDLDDLRKEQP